MGMKKHLFVSLCASLCSLKSLTNRLPPHPITQAISLNLSHLLRETHSSSVKVVESCKVSPPPGFIPNQPTFPITFFDLAWIQFPYRVECLLFYSYNHTKTHFMSTTLPNIKHSLSLTLQHFYPLAGAFTWPLQSAKPYIHCSESNLGVKLTLAESSLDFNDLVSHDPREVNKFYPLVPPLITVESRVDVPMMSLQVTLFPNTGISIGVSFLHVLADARTIYHFMKSWASVCKSGLGDTSCLPQESLPYLERIVNDPNNLENIYLKELETFEVMRRWDRPNTPNNRVRATFTVDRADIQKIKRLVHDQLSDKHKKDGVMDTACSLHLSSFVLTCSYVWVCLFKVLASEYFDGRDRERFFIPVDIRERLNPPLPNTYLGNCLVLCFVDVDRNDLIGEHGFAIAAEAIGNAIQRMKDEGFLKGAENMFREFEKMLHRGPPMFTVAGSPKWCVYDADFGWGRPRKFEIVSSDLTGIICLKESRNGDGGLEVGLALEKPEMDAFVSLFKNNPRVLS